MTGREQADRIREVAETVAALQADGVVSWTWEVDDIAALIGKVPPPGSIVLTPDEAEKVREAAEQAYLNDVRDEALRLLGDDQ